MAGLCCMFAGVLTSSKASRNVRSASFESGAASSRRARRMMVGGSASVGKVAMLSLRKVAAYDTRTHRADCRPPPVGPSPLGADDLLWRRSRNLLVEVALDTTGGTARVAFGKLRDCFESRNRRVSLRQRGRVPMTGDRRVSRRQRTGGHQVTRRHFRQRRRRFRRISAAAEQRAGGRQNCECCHTSTHVDSSAGSQAAPPPTAIGHWK